MGEFKDGNWHGRGVETYTDGSTAKEGIWADGKFVRAEKVNISSLSSAGNEAYLKMDYLEAQKIWNSSPETPNSLFGLGMLNLHGLGVKKNTEKGIGYLEKAVNAGSREAAMELGKHYRNLGDTEKALLFISKGCDEKDANCNRLQAEIYAKSNPTTLNKEQCERIRLAMYPETAPEYTDYLTCTFTGLISDMTKDQAGKKLKEQLIKLPTINGLIKLGPELLKKSSSLYDLVEFENIIWRIDPSLQNNEIKNLAKASGINEDTIADMPNFTEEQKRSRISASLIAAIGGNIKRAIFVAKYFSTSDSNEQSQLIKAKSIITLLESEKDSIDYKKIQLNIFKAESLNNSVKNDLSHKAHLTLLGEITKLDKKDEKFLSDHFSHQYSLARRFISNDAPPFTVDMVLQLANSVTLVDNNEIQTKGLNVLKQLDKKYRENLDENDETDLRKKEKLNNIAAIASDLMKKGIQLSKIEPPVKTKENSPKQEPPTNESSKRTEAKVSKRMTLNVSNTLPDSEGDFNINIKTNTDTASLKINGEEQGGRLDGNYTIKRVARVGQDTQFTITAVDINGNTDSKTVTVSRKTVESTVVTASLNPAQLKKQPARDAVAVIIGISNYKSLPRADFAKDDAQVFYDYAIRALGIKPENIKLLLDADAEEVEIFKAFKTWLPARVKSTTDVYVFYSGHGLPTSDGLGLYLLPYRADRDLISKTAVQFQEINMDIQSAKPKSVTIFMDACYSGQARGGETLIASARPLALKAQTSIFPAGFIVFSASQSDQISSSSPELKHGIFSYYLMKGMEGDADTNKDGKITLGEMQGYLAENVGRQAGMMSRKQEPQLIGDSSRILVGK
jgi:hypothetical protein